MGDQPGAFELAVQHMPDPLTHDRMTLCGMPRPPYPFGPAETCVDCAREWQRRRRANANASGKAATPVARGGPGSEPVVGDSYEAANRARQASRS
jgi:hypothetical protein